MPKTTASGSLPTESTSTRRTDALTKKLLVSDAALLHLASRGQISMQQIRAAGCCKPDGGTCCPNAGRSLLQLEAQVRGAKRARAMGPGK